ncbi:hypothetical protein FO519_001243 [Halicephalobus sp. NKZ332]|nr:hypothetical protein FO519_001243 [Halicephalobus sp. NKZ332]
MARRLSVDNWANSLFTDINTTKNELLGIWDEMALTEEQRTIRLKDSETYVASERDQVVRIRNTIAKYLAKSEALRSELGIDDSYERNIPAGLVPQANFLKMEVKSLESTKEQRMVEQLKVFETAKVACEKIGVSITDAGDFASRILPAARIAELRIQAVDAERTFKDRLSQIKGIQQGLSKIVSHIGKAEFTNNDLTMISLDYENNPVILDEQVLDNFVQLEKKAKEVFESWLAKVQFEYHDLMVELNDLWSKCHVPEEERYYPNQFDPNTQTQSDLERLKLEVAQWKLKYSEGKPIYDKLNEWLKVWEEFLEFENPHTDAGKYNNRGGALQAYLKREKQVKALVPKLLAELESLCSEHTKTNENIPTAGPGKMAPDEYASKSALNRVRNTPGSIAKTPRSTRRFNTSQASLISVIEPTIPPTVSDLVVRKPPPQNM